MKKLFITLISIIIIGGGICYLLIRQQTLTNFPIKPFNHKRYIVQKGSNMIDSFNSKSEAIKSAKKEKRAIVIDNKDGRWVYTPFEPFLIITKSAIYDFERLESALSYAEINGYKEIYYMNNYNKIWEKDKQVKDSTILDVPLIMQLPELGRGCEVTSLTMILRNTGYKVDKLQLAKEVKKDTTPYTKDSSGRISYGNPYKGFVGDIYNLRNHGYGVYHSPIVELANKYVGKKAIDLTGAEFEDLIQFVEKGDPVWIITNATYAPLDESYFEIWHTPTGIVKVTKKLHSVVITGYDKEYVYINDPLHNQKNRKLYKGLFKKAWEQMGKQAVVVLK